MLIRWDDLGSAGANATAGQPAKAPNRRSFSIMSRWTLSIPSSFIVGRKTSDEPGSFRNPDPWYGDASPSAR
jgi:hypothetical protein